MKNYKDQYIVILIFVIIFYYFITITAYYYSLYQGNLGVNVKIFSGGDDGKHYWNVANSIVNGYKIKTTSVYPIVLSYIIKWTGATDGLVIRLFNYFGFLLLLNRSLALYTFLLKRDIEGLLHSSYYRYKSILLLSFIFYLSIVQYINLSIFRDVWIYTFFITALLSSLKILSNKNSYLLNILILFLSSTGLYLLRGYAFVSFIIAFAICYFIVKAKSNGKIKKNIYIFFIFFSVYYYFAASILIPGIGLSLNDALSYRQSAITQYAGGSQMWLSLQGVNIIIFWFNYVQSILGNMIGPLFWQINSTNMMIIFIFESIPMVIILIKLYFNKDKLDVYQRCTLVFPIIWFMLIGLSNDNIGTATRLRPIGWIPIIIVLMTVFSKKTAINK